MKYKNTKTGAIIDSPCKISGGDWINLEEQPKEKNEILEEIAEVTKQAEPETEVGDFDEITIKEIKQELDAQGIKYDPKARKQELYDLMLGR